VTPPVHVVVPTVPWRRASFRQVLHNLAAQTRKPDLVHLVLDGYGDLPAPLCALPVVEHRTARCVGPGGRWRVVREVPPEAVLVSIDDDLNFALVPDLIETLVRVADGQAAACYGTTLTGRPGNTPSGEDLVCGGASSLAVRAGDLGGLQALVDEVRAAEKFDLLGDMGDDEAAVAACLWRRGVKIHHAFMPYVTFAEDVQSGSQTQKRRVADATAGRRSFFWQREAVARVTGWPWPMKTT